MTHTVILADAVADLDTYVDVTLLCSTRFSGWQHVVQGLVKQDANVDADPNLHPDMAWCIRAADEWPLLGGDIEGARPLYLRSEVDSPLGAEYSHRTPMDLLAGFRRSRQRLRKPELPNGT